MIFDGEYNEGKRWNKFGKEYYILNHELLFEGEYLKGKRWNGKVKVHNNGNLILEG